MSTADDIARILAHRIYEAIKGRADIAVAERVESGDAAPDAHLMSKTNGELVRALDIATKRAQLMHGMRIALANTMHAYGYLAESEWLRIVNAEAARMATVDRHAELLRAASCIDDSWMPSTKKGQLNERWRLALDTWSASTYDNGELNV